MSRATAAATWLALAGLLVACTPQTSLAPTGANKPLAIQPPAAIERPATLARIEQLIGSSLCNADAQCRVAGIGERPCGGAESYRAWSTSGTDAAALELDLRAYAEERRRSHEKLGVMSTCEIRPLPIARCERTAGRPEAGECVLAGSTSDLR